MKSYSLECEPCGFSVRSHNEGEVTGIGQNHVKQFHPDMKMGPADVKKMVKVA